MERGGPAKRIGRFALLALPALVAGAALLCLPGGAYARGTADQALAVAVDGPGTVTGTGISCRDGAGDCVEIYEDGASVTLTVAPDPGATFAGWGGDCSAATGDVCTLTMSSARAVTASFAADDSGNPPPTVTTGGDGSIGSSTQYALSLSVTGSGRVTGPGINCGDGAGVCSKLFPAGTTVSLTAVPTPGTTFAGWGGACSGTGRVCELVMGSAMAASASFEKPSTPSSNGGGSGGQTFPARSLGRPIVVRNRGGWAVSLRFYTSRSSTALLRLSRNGRAVKAFTFSPRAGNVLVGPFNVGKAGAYVFRLTLSEGRDNTAALTWSVCISPCGGTSFTLRSRSR
jgi:hypothetical protein